MQKLAPTRFCRLPVRYLLRSYLLRSLTLVLMGLGLASGAQAEGSAVFASVTSSAQEQKVRAQIAADFGIEVRSTSAWVNEVNWTRLQSSVMPEDDARALVSRALSKGYTAWYNSEGNKWAESRDQSGGAPQAVTTSKDSASNDWGVIKPATGDVSHLPLAETFPIE